MGLEFAVGKSAFGEEISKMLSPLQKKSGIPVLDCIRMESDGQALNLMTTNMETTIRSRFESKLLAVTQPGVICMPAKQLADIVRLAPEGPMKFTGDDNHWVHIIGQRSRFKKPGLDPALWPPLPAPENLSWVEVPSAVLKAMLPCVKYAISQEETRHNLRGAKLEIDSNGARMVATDGHRISLASAVLDTLPASDFEILIPVEGVDELNKLVTDNAGSVGIAPSPNCIFFRIGTRIVSTRLITGKFPNYEMPFQMLGTYEGFGTFKSDELAQSIERAMLCAKKEEGKKNAAQGVSLTFETGQLKIKSVSEDGEANEVLDSNFNQPVKVFYNGKYLVDYLKPLGSEEVRIEIKDNITQMYLTATKDKVVSYGIIMPMRE